MSADIRKNTRYLDATRATDVAIYRNSCEHLCVLQEAWESLTQQRYPGEREEEERVFGTKKNA